jgi:hypothetical protein
MTFHDAFVMSRQGVRDHVQFAMPVLHRKIIAEKFTHPSVLWDCCPPLIQYELEGKVISLDEEEMSP